MVWCTTQCLSFHNNGISFCRRVSREGKMKVESKVRMPWSKLTLMARVLTRHPSICNTLTRITATTERIFLWSTFKRLRSVWSHLESKFRLLKASVLAHRLRKRGAAGKYWRVLRLRLRRINSEPILTPQTWHWRNKLAISWTRNLRNKKCQTLAMSSKKDSKRFKVRNHIQDVRLFKKYRALSWPISLLPPSSSKDNGRRPRCCLRTIATTCQHLLPHNTTWMELNNSYTSSRPHQHLCHRKRSNTRPRRCQRPIEASTNKSSSRWYAPSLTDHSTRSWHRTRSPRPTYFRRSRARCTYGRRSRGNVNGSSAN